MSKSDPVCVVFRESNGKWFEQAGLSDKSKPCTFRIQTVFYVYHLMVHASVYFMQHSMVVGYGGGGEGRYGIWRKGLKKRKDRKN